MKKNFIPNFKRSNDSLQKDILKLKKLELISDGWYKGQLIKLMDKVAGKVVIDGIICYDTNIVINGYTNKNDNSERAKNTRELLKLFGLNDNALDNIYNTWINNELDAILLNFDKKEDYDKIFTIDEFKETYGKIKELIQNAQSFELTHNNTKYLETDTERPSVSYSEWYNGSAWIEDSIDFDVIIDISEGGSGTTYIPIRDYSAGQIMHYSSLKIFDENEIDITLTYSQKIVDAIKMLLLFSGNNIMQRDSVVKLSEKVIINEDETNYIIVETKETYTKIYNEYFVINQFWKYKNGVLKLQYYTDDGIYELRDIIAFDFWDVFLYLDSFDNDKSNDLFYVSKRSKSLLDRDEIRRLNVNGIKKHSAKNIASGISRYADFKIIRPRKKKRFLGMGGFIGSFLGGLFELVIKAISFVAEILYYIPVVRVQIQFIGWIFSGKWSNNKERFVQLGTRILIAVIAALIVFLTSGAGWELALSLASSAYSIYSGMKEYDDLVEASNKKQLDNDSVKDKELYDKVLDLSNKDDILKQKNELMYKPYTEINNTYRNTFDKGGMYDIKFGL